MPPRSTRTTKQQQQGVRRLEKEFDSTVVDVKKDDADAADDEVPSTESLAGVAIEKKTVSRTRKEEEEESDSVAMIAPDVNGFSKPVAEYVDSAIAMDSDSSDSSDADDDEAEEKKSSSPNKRKSKAMTESDSEPSDADEDASASESDTNGNVAMASTEQTPKAARRTSKKFEDIKPVKKAARKDRDQSSVHAMLSKLVEMNANQRVEMDAIRTTLASVVSQSSAKSTTSSAAAATAVDGDKDEPMTAGDASELDSIRNELVPQGEVSQAVTGFYEKLERSDAPAAFKKWTDDAIDALDQKLNKDIAATEQDLKKSIARLGTKTHSDAIDLLEKRANDSIIKLREQARLEVEKMQADVNDPAAIERHFLSANAWMHPDETMKLWCRRTGNNMWWEDQIPAEWKLTATAKKGPGQSGHYLNLTTERSQRLSPSQPEFERNLTFILPAACVQYPKVYPHGNRDATMFAPHHPYETKYQLTITEASFGSTFNATEPPNQTNIKRAFSWMDTTVKAAIGKLIWEKDGVASQLKAKFRMGIDQSKRDDGAYLREQFLATKVKSQVTIDKQGDRIMRCEADVVRKPFATEMAKLGRNPPVAATQWLHDLYYNPSVRKADKPKAGEPPAVVDPSVKYAQLYAPDLPMFRAVTRHERMPLKTGASHSALDPITLVPVKFRELTESATAYYIVTPSLFDSNKDNTMTGFSGLLLKGIIWVGDSYALDEQLEKPIPKSADLSQFFVTATKYNIQPIRTGDQLPPDQTAVDLMVAKNDAPPSPLIGDECNKDATNYAFVSQMEQ